jgi:hypothetical protein
VFQKPVPGRKLAAEGMVALLKTGREMTAGMPTASVWRNCPSPRSSTRMFFD